MQQSDWESAQLGVAQLWASRLWGLSGMMGVVWVAISVGMSHAAVGLRIAPSNAATAPLRPVVERANAAGVDMAQFPEILLDVIPPGVIPDGEFIQQMSELVRTVGDRQGQYAVLTAGVLANTDPNVSRWLTAIESSPFRTVEINGLELGVFAQQLATTVDQRNAAVEAIARQADQAAMAYSDVDFATLPDLRQAGPLGVQKQTLSVGGEGDLASAQSAAIQIAATQATAAIMVDAYFPESLILGGLTGGEPDPAPVLLISHGLGSDRTDFAELAEHLASYGFVVVVPDHQPTVEPEEERSPTSSLDDLRARFFGAMNPEELVKRPLTLSAILDEMEQLNISDPMVQGRLDLNNVGIIGHSLGGYTGLAMVTGDINRSQLKSTCRDDEILALNLSLLLQCQARALPRRLPSLSDSRIKAVMALNPIGSAVLGESQIKDIDVPVMIVAGSHDAIAPMMAEQLPLFSWLTTTHKYLVTLDPGGHASANVMVSSPDNTETPRQSDGIDQVISGPISAQGGQATKALSVAFMTTYLSSPLADITPAESYLNAAYGQFLSEGVFDVYLVDRWAE